VTKVCDVANEMAYKAGLERAWVSVDGRNGPYTLTATLVYLREDGEWKVAHPRQAVRRDESQRASEVRGSPPGPARLDDASHGKRSRAEEDNHQQRQQRKFVDGQLRDAPVRDSQLADEGTD
jgi:hypothetical protein